MRKPILCLDFDGVCHSYVSGWKGADVISDPPVPGMCAALEAFREHFEIHVFSARSSHPGGINAMSGWFAEAFTTYWFEKEPELRMRFERFLCPDWLIFDDSKPAAFVTIDDRAITFTGVWPSADDLIAFKPWYKTQAAHPLTASGGGKNGLTSERDAMREQIAGLVAERDALRVENEAAHVYLDECYINDPDERDAGTKPLAGRIMDLDDAHGREIVALREQVAALVEERDALAAENAKLQEELANNG